MRFRRILSTILVYTLIVCGVSFISTLEANADSNRYNRTIDLSNEYLEEELVGAWIWDRDSDSDHIRPPIIYYLYADGSYEGYSWSPDDFDEETLSTINKFFENSLNVSETSRQLYIHRNTLVYRLDKLQKQTGLDLRVFEDAITLKIALMVVKYMNYMEAQDY